MLITDLPDEVLTHLFKFLTGPQLSTLRLVNIGLHNLIAQDIVWMDKCTQEYKVTSLTGWSFDSYYELYTKVLHHFGYLIGVWQADMPPYGSLIEIKNENGKLVGRELSAPCPPKINQCLRERLMFTVEMKNSKPETLCHMGPNSITHECRISLADDTNKHVLFRCCVEAAHRNPGGMRREFEQFMMDESAEISEIIFTGKIELLQKFRVVKKFETHFDLFRLEIPPLLPHAVFQPGIYKGDYNIFGYELVLVNYTEYSQKIVASKITGDPRVPAGEIAFEGNLNEPIFLSAEHQESFSTILENDQKSLPISYKDLPEQDFLIPQDCLYEGTRLPTTCTARFHAKMRVFPVNGNSADYLSSHLIVFNSNMFAMLTFEAEVIHSFHRVEDYFL